MPRLSLATLAAVVLLDAGCRRPSVPPGDPAVPDSVRALVVGAFEDDYGDRYTITPASWFQAPYGRYHIVRWNADAGYLVARNDSANRHAPGRWTRIDWLPLTGMAPYAWAFCMSAYDAPTRAAAESSTVARRATPRTGCGGHPFTRMRRVPLAP